MRHARHYAYNNEAEIGRANTFLRRYFAPLFQPPSFQLATVIHSANRLISDNDSVSWQLRGKCLLFDSDSFR